MALERAQAEPSTVEARLRALGPARDDEAPILAQAIRALATAEEAEAGGDFARAERHRSLALALVRNVEARRRLASLRARVEQRRRALAALHGEPPSGERQAAAPEPEGP